MGRLRTLYFGSWDGYPDCAYRCVARIVRRDVSEVMIYNRDADGDTVFLNRWDPGVDAASIESMLKRIRGYRYIFTARSFGSGHEINWRLSNYTAACGLPDGTTWGVGYVRRDGSGHCVTHTVRRDYERLSSGWVDPQSPQRTSSQVWGDVGEGRVMFIFTLKKKTSPRPRPY